MSILAFGEALMHCPRCGSEKLIEISMRLHSEDDVTFRSCHACEYKWWERNTDQYAEQVNLDTVLDLATVTRTA
ncbi:MAG: hypothetical protein DCC49_06165 [Acidobacteria bacterium]|nr:MAG: hypothetical protein DCC49_06165 [Acidobacteriota bacterium]